jgi:HSP20 family protein
MTMNTETRAVAAQTRAEEVQPPEARPIQWSRPAVDLLERDDALILALDAPGVPAGAFEIQVEDRTLSVSGARSDGVRGWRRAFALPPTVDSAGIGARVEHGVLFLTLPKSEAARPRKIEVR